MSEEPRVRAVQYLRMSTEHQRYSLGNQASVIADYAEAKGYEICRTYLDPGRSGLTLKERKGLQSLLADAISLQRDFSAVLVLDVSRWGRFQDLDQSAHYEFLCREAGVAVVYCAEAFDNDGSATASIVKQLKRLMAAEYSRELSSKVSSARRRHAAMGHHQGGGVPYGFRRVVVDASGNPRAPLEPGYRKPLPSDYVTLIPGPREEQAVIRRIFLRYVIGERGMATIARELNADGAPAAEGASWTAYRVRSVLKNERVIGNYVFAKTRRYLKAPRKVTPPETWIRVRVGPAIVPPSLFRRATIRRLAHVKELPEQMVLLAGLRRLLREHGCLTYRLINACVFLPGVQAITRSFGSINNAYVKIGYFPDWSSYLDAEEDSEKLDRNLLALLRAAHDRHGYLTSKVIEADASLPSFKNYAARFGSLRRAYELAGLPHTQSELLSAANRRAQTRRMAEVELGLTDADLLAGLRRLWERDGYVCLRTIDADPHLIGHQIYLRRFGSLCGALEHAGLPSDRLALLHASVRRRGTVKVRPHEALELSRG
ncbi:recombinase family protein [Phenylobacterium sp. LjRoot219]|uniref:recombinase family protein n=1 Tax=Phenylobacterium sp. LjRoot219 TaxID=3342283 RepID=UPI003ECF5291